MPTRLSRLVWTLAFASAYVGAPSLGFAQSGENEPEPPEVPVIVPSEDQDAVEEKLIEIDRRADEVDEEDEMMLDSFRRGVEDSVNATARWFDNFFGDGRSFESHQYRSQGRVSLAPEWSGYDGWRMRSRFRAQTNLPYAQERFSAFIGRVDTDDYVVGDDSERRASVLRGVDSDSEWLVGLGFNPGQGEESRFSITGGIRGGINADLYTEGRYLYQIRVSDTIQVRTRSALFWRDSDGFGFDQRADYEQVWGDDWLGRLSVEGTSAERIDGIRWRNSAALYHLYTDDKAIAGEFWYRGESKAVVADQDFGVRLIHRQSWLRDWFFVQTWVGSHWPRGEEDTERNQAWLAGVEFEVWFGR